MLVAFALVVVGLEIKHYVADYLGQNDWILRGKGSLRAGGGYVHAAGHVLGSAIVLAMAQVPLGALAMVLLAEFVIHYAMDFTKANVGRSVSSASQPRLYWAMHGFDQLLHHLTYVAMAYTVLVVLT